MATNKSRQINKVDWSAPPATVDTTKLQGMANTGYDYATPLRNEYARAEQQLSRSYNNPLGAYTTADVRDKTMRAQNASMSQNLGMDLANAAQQSNASRFGQQATVAGLTAPRMYNSSSSSPFTGGDALNIGIQGALGALQ